MQAVEAPGPPDDHAAESAAPPPSLASFPADPLCEFERWWREAGTDEVALATVDAEGAPSARMVLLRGLDHGFVFFTDRRSAKGRDLTGDDRAALVFRWPPRRQVRAAGRVRRVDRDESEAYWRTRPRASQLAAWSSPQSQPIPSRAWLEEQVTATATRFGDGDVPLPPFWGGFRLVAETIEFWTQGADRLHHRVRYRKVTGSWVVDLLGP